jgi:hypothetical protein
MLGSGSSTSAVAFWPCHKTNRRKVEFAQQLFSRECYEFSSVGFQSIGNSNKPECTVDLRRALFIGSDKETTNRTTYSLCFDVVYSGTSRATKVNGKVLCVTGPVGSSDAKLRRAQALAMSNGIGLEICRRLIGAKLQGQENVLRERLNCHPNGRRNRWLSEHASPGVRYAAGSSNLSRSCVLAQTLGLLKRRRASGCAIPAVRGRRSASKCASERRRPSSSTFPSSSRS